MTFRAFAYLGLSLIAIFSGLGCGDRDEPEVSVDPDIVNLYFDSAPGAPSLNGNVSIGTINDTNNVYDGDTIKDVRFLLCEPCALRNPVLPISQEGNKIYFWSDIRIRGIDTPELAPNQSGRTPESINREKALAIQARDYLRHQLATATGITMINQEEDKYYGRIVADIIIHRDGKEINVGDRMIACGYAVKYDGGTKTMDWGQAGITPICNVPTHITNELGNDNDLNDTQDNARIVYKTKTGAKYHHKGCPHLRQSQIPITIAAAAAEDLEPCNLFQ